MEGAVGRGSGWQTQSKRSPVETTRFPLTGSPVKGAL